MEYSNARRDGRTHPDRIEIIDRTDPRHRHYAPDAKDRPKLNRRQRRAAGMHYADPIKHSPRKWQPPPWVADQRLARRSSPRVTT